jgi:hypothetical protein
LDDISRPQFAANWAFMREKHQRRPLRKLALFVVAPLAVCWFIASPFLTVWELRQAARTGDVAYLERKVDWIGVRGALRRSSDEAQRMITELAEIGGVPKPSFWQRVAAATLPLLSSTLIDRYVTPQGAPQLYAWHQTWVKSVRPTLGLEEPPTALAGTWAEGTGLDKTLTVLRRLDRAEFTSPMRVEIELRSRYAPQRSYRAVLELRSFEWKLTEFYVLSTPTPPKLADKSRAS